MPAVWLVFSALLASAPVVSGHGMMTVPVSRNFNMWARDTSFGDPQSLNQEPLCGGTTAKKGYFNEWHSKFEIKAPSNEKGIPYAPLLAADLDGKKASPVTLAGSTLEIGFVVTAHHNGYLEARLCVDPPEGAVSADCLAGDDKALKRTSETAKEDPLPMDEKYPERYYLMTHGVSWGDGKLRKSAYPATYVDKEHPQITPIVCDGGACFQRPPTWSFSGKDFAQPGDAYKWKVELSNDQISSCTGKLCVIQMLYVTANSCSPPGLQEYFQSDAVAAAVKVLPDTDVANYWQAAVSTCSGDSYKYTTFAGAPEKFWNCADIVIGSDTALLAPKNGTVRKALRG